MVFGSPCSLSTLLCHCLGRACIKLVDPVLCLGLATLDTTTTWM